VLHQLITIPREQRFVLACSGGSDSMALADFYKRGGRKFTAAYYNHGTPQADEMQRHVSLWCILNDVPFATSKLTTPKPKEKSPEEHWRDERYKWLLSDGLPVITAHHLNDVAETYLFTALNGTPRLIPARNGHIIRPFLTNPKSELTSWCVRHNIKWIEDQSNTNIKGPRNRIRHAIMPEALKVNPGLLTVLKKRVIAAHQLHETITQKEPIQ
jgi:tRNA(Ile)-lysidine synthase